MCNRHCSTVTPALPLAANSGQCFATGSVTLSLPRSTSSSTHVAVVTGFVSEAMSKIVSAVIGSAAGATARRPNALR